MIIVWRVTQSCNLSCPFCGFDRRLDRVRRDADVETVTRFGAVLSEYQRATGDRVLVSWMGGEPLLWPPLRELTEHFARRLGVHLGTTTNGTPLGSSLVRDHIIEHYSELTISVDGIDRVHDELRGWRGGFAQLRRVIPMLVAERQTRGRGPLLRVNVVLMHDTVGDFERLCCELANWGIDEITFNQLGGDDRPEFFQAHRLLPSDVEWLSANLPRVRKALEPLGVRLRGTQDYLRRLAATASHQRIPVGDCAPGEQFLFIDERARVAPCSFSTRDYGIPLDGIDTWEALQQLPRRFSKMRAALRASCCGDCHSTHVFEKFRTAQLKRAGTATAIAPA